MEITGWTIYWITRLDGLHWTMFWLGFVATAASALALFFGIVLQNDKEDWPTLYSEERRKMYRVWIASVRRWAMRGLALGAAVLVSACFVPTTREAAAILVIPALANNEDVQGLGEDFVNLAREWMQELRPKEEKK